MIPGSGRAGLIRSLKWLAWPYEWGARVRALAYRCGWLSTYRLPRPVISIGNLTVGGTGKTPVVISAAECMLAQGKRVAVLSRGYRRRKARGPLLVSDGRALLAGPDAAGDEPYLIAQRCPRAIVAVGPDRYRLGRWVLERQAVDCFILDDGFQHMHLSRDLNVLLLDATDWAGIQALVPIGRLREPLSAAARADALFLTRVDQSTRVEDIWQAVRRACKRLPDPVHLTFKADELVHVATGERKTMDQFKKQTALLFSGIGNPRAFHDLVRRQGVAVSDTVILGDHARYDETVIRGIRHRAQQVNAELWITTEKDAGKIKTLVSQEDPCWAVRLSTAIPGGCDLWERLLGRGIARSQEDNRG